MQLESMNWRVCCASLTSVLGLCPPSIETRRVNLCYGCFSVNRCHKSIPYTSHALSHCLHIVSVCLQRSALTFIARFNCRVDRSLICTASFARPGTARFSSQRLCIDLTNKHRHSTHRSFIMMTSTNIHLSDSMSQFLSKPRVKGEWLPDIAGLNRLSKTEVAEDLNTIHDALVQSGMDGVSDQVRASARRRAGPGATGVTANSLGVNNTAAAGGASDAINSTRGGIHSTSNNKRAQQSSVSPAQGDADQHIKSRRQRLHTKIVNERSVDSCCRSICTTELNGVADVDLTVDCIY